MSKRRQHRRLDKVKETTNADCEIRRRVVTLLPENYPRDPDFPRYWKDREAMEEWIETLPDHHEVILLNIVNVPPEERTFENEVRPPNH
jgi:hypothetical protein